MSTSKVKILSLNKGELVNQHTHLKQIEIKADDRISRGGCLVESDFSTIDAMLETQLQEIERALYKELENDPK